MNPRILVPALLSLAQIAHADTLPSHLEAVRIHLTSETISTSHTYSTRTVRGQIVRRLSLEKKALHFPGAVIDGYILWSPYNQPIQYASATIREQVGERFRGEHLSVWPIANLFQVQFPEPAIVSTTVVSSLVIPLQEIRRLEKISGRFDGHMKRLGELTFIPPDQAILRQRGKPIFQCSVYAGEMADEILVSYNPHLNETTMKTWCKKNTDPNVIPTSLTDEEIAEFLKNADVFILNSPVE